MSKKKVAVVIFNLGGPDSLKAIRPFLLNFFTDKNIIPLPYPLRRLIALLIAYRRSRGEALESYKALGGKSPLLENTLRQADLLKNCLSEGNDSHAFETFVCMRYWHPMTEDVIQQVEAYDADQIILLPFYPQFSTTTTWSSLEEWAKFTRKSSLSSVQTSTICCYPREEGFINASVKHIREMYEKAVQDGYKNIRILFSAHGLPESIIDSGDPYQEQCELTVNAIVSKLGIDNLDYQNCYQSRVGPKKWIGPATDESIVKASDERIDALVVYPHAFVNEHVETLVEIEQEYRDLAKENGINGFYRVNTVSDNSSFIKGLASMVFSRLDKNSLSSNEMQRVCSSGAKRCCMQMRNA